MNVLIPNWFLILSAVGIAVWIFAGIEAFKAFKVIKERNGGGLGGGHYKRHFLPPQTPTNQDDADWWKRG